MAVRRPAIAAERPVKNSEADRRFFASTRLESIPERVRSRLFRERPTERVWQSRDCPQGRVPSMESSARRGRDTRIRSDPCVHPATCMNYGDGSGRAPLPEFQTGSMRTRF